MALESALESCMAHRCARAESRRRRSTVRCIDAARHLSAFHAQRLKHRNLPERGRCAEDRRGHESATLPPPSNSGAPSGAGCTKADRHITMRGRRRDERRSGRAAASAPPLVCTTWLLHAERDAHGPSHGARRGTKRDQRPERLVESASLRLEPAHMPTARTALGSARRSPCGCSTSSRVECIVASRSDQRNARCSASCTL